MVVVTTLLTVLGGCTRLGFDESGLQERHDAAPQVADSLTSIDVLQVVDSGPADLTGDSTVLDATIDSTLLDQTVDSTRDQTIDSAPDQTIDSTRDQTIDSAPDQTIDSAPDQTIDSAPDQTIDSAPDQTIDSAPDQTIDSAQPAPADVVYSWVQNFGDLDANEGFDVVVDANDNITVVGQFWGTVDFGGGALTSTGMMDIFVASYTASGAHRWSKRFGSTSVDIGTSIAGDSSGNVTITGYCGAPVDFGGGPFVDTGSIFIASYDSSGNHRWSTRFGGPGGEYPLGVTVDPNGNTTITGYFYETVDFGGGPLTSAGSGDVFVASYDPGGAYRWAKRFGGSSVAHSGGVAADSAGNVTIIGDFAFNANFGGATLKSAGSMDLVLASYTSEGAHRWSYRYGNSSQEYGTDIVVDSDDNISIIGRFDGTVDFGGTPVVCTAATDVFVASYDSSGAHRWSRGFGGSSSLDYGNGITVDSSGNVMVTGAFYDPTDFGGGKVTSAGLQDIFVASYDPSGVYRWAKTFGGTTIDEGNAVAVDSSGNVTTTGYFRGTADLGEGPVVSSSGYDIFILQLGP